MAPRRRKRSRVFLWAWALFSLVLLVWTGLVYAASVPVTAADANGFARGEEAPMSAGDRLVLDIAAAGPAIGTVAAGSDGVLGAPGDVLYFFTDAQPRDPGRPLPVQNPGLGLGRALVFVARNTTAGGWDVPVLGLTNVTSVTVPGVPLRNQSTDAFEAANLTIDLTGFTGTSGFVVKRDATVTYEDELVPPDRVLGRVARVLPPSSMWQSVVLAGLGFVTPLVLIMLSHRGAGRAAETGPVCQECGAGVDAGFDFCPRCGATFAK